MMTAPANLSQAYIDEHYITRPALAGKARITEARIVELAEKRCIPPPAYEAVKKRFLPVHLALTNSKAMFCTITTQDMLTGSQQLKDSPKAILLKTLQSA
jgi:hypothetical protein